MRRKVIFHKLNHNEETLTVNMRRFHFNNVRRYLKRGWFTEDKDILKISTKDEWTIAHEQASIGWTTEDKEILNWTDKNGNTVAKIQELYRKNYNSTVS